MGSLSLTMFTFVAVTMAVLGLWSMFGDLLRRDQDRFSRRVDAELRSRQRVQVQKSLLFKNPGAVLPELAHGAAPAVDWRTRLQTMIDQSGIPLTPRLLLLASLVSTLVVGVSFWLLNRNLLIACSLAPFGAIVPPLYVRWRRRARIEKLLGQLPDAFDLMARLIRAGETMAQAMRTVSEEFEPPVAEEFSYCYEQQNLGLSSEVALRDLARRTGLLELKFFVLGMLVQQQTGGNLAGLLDNIASVVRERFRVLGRIQALTGEGRMQAVVLEIIPWLVFLLIMLLHPQYGNLLLGHKFFLCGGDALLGIAVLEGIGAMWIHKITHFDF